MAEKRIIYSNSRRADSAERALLFTLSNVGCDGFPDLPSTDWTNSASLFLGTVWLECWQMRNWNFTNNMVGGDKRWRILAEEVLANTAPATLRWASVLGQTTDSE